MIFTIGHSNRSSSDFITTLLNYQITALADVRSSPYSRYLPHFNQKELRALLKSADIAYVYLGDCLGGRTDDPTYLHDDGRVDYERLRESDTFKQGMLRLNKGMEQYRIALMCSERDPMDCHRGLMISRSLHERRIDVTHIIDQDSSIRHDECLMRLLDKYGMQHDMFASRESLIDMAYQRRAMEVAYTSKTE